MRSTHTVRNLFIEHLLNEVVACTDARRLTEIGTYAQSIREPEVMRLVGTRLNQMRVGGIYSDAGKLFESLALNHIHGCRVLTEAAFKQLAESSSLSVRPRAFLALGSNSYQSGDFTEAWGFYQRAQALNDDCELSTFCSLLMSAVILSAEGHHDQALEALNKLAPFARFIRSYYPAYYYQHLNSTAVVLSDLGHHDQALKVASVAASSPYSKAYPEFKETVSEIQLKRPSHNVSSLSDFVARRDRQDQQAELLLQKRLRVAKVALHTGKTDLVERLFELAKSA